MGDENPIRTLGDYSKPSHEGYRNTIEPPLGNNDPNQHLKNFLKLVDSLDLDGENRERTRLCLFQFSLRDQASNWLERLSAGSITTWEDLTTRFLAQLFPPKRTVKLRNDIPMFQQHHGESVSEAWTRFNDLLQKVPHHGINLWLKVQIFYDHVNPVTRRTINQSAGGKLRDLNGEESWALLEDLALYDNESWNDPRDFAKPVKEITLPHDVLSTSDRRLIELKNQVQRLMEAYLALTQPTQVNKVTTSCEICSGPHDTQYCMKDPEQAFVEYTSLHTDEVGDKGFTPNQGPRNFNDATNTWKEKPNFNWERTQTFTSPQNGSISTHSSTYQMKLEKALLDFDSHQERRRRRLINQRARTRPQKYGDKKRRGKEEDEMGTTKEVEELFKDEESEMETKEEVEEVFDDETEEEEDDDAKYYNSPPAIKELVYHEWLLKNP
ncbi:MAK10-like protein [Tanacetum coccineum]